MSTGRVRTSLDISLAIHYLGCADYVDGCVAVPGMYGPFIECLGRLVSRIVIVAYDPPASAPAPEDTADYVLSADIHADIVSLGDRGSWRDYLTRRKRIARSVGAASADWDVLFFRLVNRRAGLVLRAARTARLVSQTGGYTPEVVLRAGLPLTTRVRSWAAAQIAERTYRRLARRGLFFANGEELVERYREVAPNVQLLRTSTRLAEFSSWRQDCPLDPPRLLLAGRLVGAKGIYDALDAFAAVKERFRDARLDVVGDGEDRRELERRVGVAGLSESVSFHGWLTPGRALFDVLASADVMLQLSRSESMPRLVWDAMAHSVLVVSTAVGSLPRVFTHERELLFVPVGDPHAAAAAVEVLVGDGALRRRLLAAGRVAAEVTTCEVVAAQLVEALADRWPELTA